MDEQLYFLGIKAIIQNDQGQILVLKHAKGYWDFPGGRISQNEAPLDALKREVKEETGIDNLANIEPDKMILTPFQIPRKDSKIGLVLWYHICQIKGDATIELSCEHVEYQWTTFAKARELTKLDSKICLN